MAQRTPTLALAFACIAATLSGCTSSGADTAASAWTGSIDTLPSGQVVVTNPDRPMWPPSGGWRLVEDLRIGTVEGTGPDLFGRIWSLAVDAGGRIYVLESQAQEIRVFNADGSHLRTIGRKGGGPGEFSQALLAQFGPGGNLWVVDPPNNRLSMFDTAGVYVAGHRMPGGFMIMPWPGGFDDRGDYYSPVPKPAGGTEFRIALAHFDSALQIIDTLPIPTDPVKREHFELRNGRSRVQVSIPFDASFRWLLSPRGTLWGILTGEYRFFELSHTGDTLRTITRAFEPLPLTDADRDEARERLSWFTRDGGKPDWSRLPSTKPAIEHLTFDDHGNFWVWPVTGNDEKDRVFDVFDSVGRYLGRVSAPLPIARQPVPVFRNGVMYAVTLDDLGVPFVVRMRIERP